MTCADSSNKPRAPHAPPPCLLAIGGADERLQIALGRYESGSEDRSVALLASQEWHVPGQAARFLAPGIRNMLDALGLAASDISRIACDTGPGSFTGLRMALALAQGMAAAAPREGGALLAGLNHLELLAHEAAQSSNATVLPLAWSRRGQVYAQPFSPSGSGHSIAPLGPARSLALDALPALLATLPRPVVLLGGGLRRNLAHFQALSDSDPGLTLLPPVWDNPRPETLLFLAARAEYRPALEIAPTYLRASDAEENLTAIAAQRGLSAEEAQAILDRGSKTL